MQSGKVRSTVAVKILMCLALGLGALWISSAANAQTYTSTFDVYIDFSSLKNSVAGPFSLDFQLVAGGSPANNSVQLSNFQSFTGGAFTGSPTLTNATSAGGAITLSDNTSIFSEFTQGFTPGDLKFEVKMTGNFDATSPDGFSFGLLDSTGHEIPTLDPSGANSFLTLDFSAATPALATYASDPSQPVNAGGGPVSIGAPVLTPEGDSLLMLAMGGVPVVGLFWRARRRRTV